MNPEQFAAFLTASVAADVKSTALFANNYLHTIDRGTLLALQHGGQGGRLAELATASHTPNSASYFNPWAVPKPVGAAG
jgi:hypothetical protein